MTNGRNGVANETKTTVAPESQHARSGAGYAGYLYIAASAIFWGISATLGRAAFTGRLLPNSGIRSINPVILSQCRTSFSFLAVAAWLLRVRGWKRLIVPRADIARLFVIGLAGVAASNYFYYLAIQKTNVATAIIVQYTAPVWVLLYMIVRGVQKATAARVLSVVLAVAGSALAIGVVGTGTIRINPVGLAAAMAASLS